MSSITRARRVRRAAALLATPLIALAAVSLTGCADEEEALTAGGGASSAEEADSSEGVDDGVDDAEATEAENSEEEESEKAALTGEACLYGNWYLDNESFSAILEQAGGNVTDMSGGVVVSFQEGGTTMTTYDNWTMVIGGQNGGESTLTRDGEDSGTFTWLDDGTISVTETNSGSEASMTISSNGQGVITKTAPHEPSPVTQGTVVCTEETLEVTADGATTTFLREN